MYYFIGNYWVYHKNQVDLTHMYTNPEEKLWHIVKNRVNKDKNGPKGFKLEKN